MKRAATFITLLFAALVFPAGMGGAGEVHDGAPPRLLEWPMLPGESLSQLAYLIYPDDAIMQRRFIAVAMRENPATFPQIAASQKFDQETMIWLPDLKELSQLASSAKSPRHYLRPVLPAMQPSVAGAKPSPLQMSAAIVDKPMAVVEGKKVAAEGVELTTAPVIRHMNAMPMYDRDAVVAIEVLLRRNQVLKKEQEALDKRIAILEAGITEAREAIARDRRRSPRRIKRVAAPGYNTVPMVPDSLLSPSPLHLLTAAGILLVGGGWAWLRRRRRPDNAESVLTPVPLKKSGSQKQELDFGEPVSAVYIEENFVDDGFISVDEIASIVEEAKIFVALGRTDHAIEVLEDYIATHPRASAHPWLYLIEIYRSMQRRDDFEAVAKRFHEAMNVIAPQWEKSEQTMMVVPHSLMEFPHLLVRLADSWGTLDAQDFLNHLIQDNRGGERQGFSMEVLQEILLLLAILEMRDHMPAAKAF